jgi:pilus assembly protein CpaF
MAISTEFSLAAAGTTAALPEHFNPAEQQFQQLKVNIHQRLVESLDLSQIHRISELPQWSGNVRRWAAEVCPDEDLLKQLDHDRLAEELAAELLGLGPLEKLMRDPGVSDILVNGPYTVYVERHGRLELTDCIFADGQHLLRIIQRIVGRLGRRIDEMSPMVDARLPDGSRVNAIIPPLAIDGATLSIRRFGVGVLRLEDLLANGSLVGEIAEFVAAAVHARIGCVVSGGSGAGKTTLLNILSSFIPASERTITIEDSAELKFQHRHWVRLETRPANTEGAGEVTQRDLVRNCLRMRPDRIIVGEVRGAEVWDMLQAMNTGHEGSLTTIHANSAQDALARMEMMVALAGFELPVSVVRQYIACGIQLIVQLARLAGGPRRVMRVSELLRAEGGAYLIEDIFGYEQLGVDAEGVAEGEFYVTGYRPACLARIEAAGIHLPEALFQRRQIPELRWSPGPEPRMDATPAPSPAAEQSATSEAAPPEAAF